MLSGITIDSERTLDMDDSIHVERTPEGWLARVMIADVAKYVAPGSEVARTASELVETKYFATGNAPMLPRVLAENLLSLVQDQERNVLVIEARLAKDLTPVETRVYPDTMINKARLTYTVIPEILRDTAHPLHAMIRDMVELTMNLLAARRNNGALAFYDLNEGWVMNEDGSLKKMQRREDTIGYVVIQELMILANTTIATIASEHDVPFIYRNHTVKANTPPRGEIMRMLATEYADPELLRLLQKSTAMSMNRAEYAGHVIGHYGLNLPVYCHFTSPIRRYADLVNHQQIRAYLNHEQAPYTREQIQEIALTVNTRLVEYEKARAAASKKKAEGEATRVIEEKRYEGMLPAIFERATKLQVRSGQDCHPAYVEAFMARIATNNVPIAAAVLVLTQTPDLPEWNGLKDALLKRIVEEPSLAPSIYSSAINLSGYQKPDFTVVHTIQGDTTIYIAKATGVYNGIQVSTEEYVEHTKKAACQRACIALLALAAHRPVPVFPEVRLPESKGKTFVLDTTGAKDPIMNLQEHAQAYRNKLPDYEFSINDITHTVNGAKTTIVKHDCVCAYNGDTTHGDGCTKKDAKRKAALAMITKIAGLTT